MLVLENPIDAEMETEVAFEERSEIVVVPAEPPL
jgi:hypothetical protein